jgi:S2P endopeptidase
MATLSLFFFNLLPLPFLDGSELLCALMDLATDSEDTFSFDVEALETGRGGVRADRGILQRAKSNIKRYVPYGTLGIVIMSSLFSIGNALI